MFDFGDYGIVFEIFEFDFEFFYVVGMVYFCVVVDVVFVFEYVEDVMVKG